MKRLEEKTKESEGQLIRYLHKNNQNPIILTNHPINNETHHSPQLPLCLPCCHAMVYRNEIYKLWERHWTAFPNHSSAKSNPSTIISFNFMFGISIIWIHDNLALNTRKKCREKTREKRKEERTWKGYPLKMLFQRLFTWMRTC